METRYLPAATPKEALSCQREAVTTSCCAADGSSVRLRALTESFDVAIRDGRIAAVEPSILPSSATETIDVSGKLVLPGLIDTHGHVYQYVTGRFGLNADMVGVRSAVTTVVDQGGPSCMTLPGFRHFVAEKAETRVYAFLSAYLVGGLEGHFYPNLYSPSGVDIGATVASANANKDIVRGIKGHAEIGGFARWGIRVMEMAAEIGRRTNLPLYVHFGTLWTLPDSGANGEDADTILERVIPLLKPGDVLAHPFTRHPGGFVNRKGEVHKVIKAALDKGLKVDVGHGSHFSYRLARKALDAGMVPHTLGADMHGYNTEVPAPPGTPARARRRREPPLQRSGPLQPYPGDELDDGARAAARDGRADGHVQRCRDARPCRPDRRIEARVRGGRHGARRRARAFPPARQRGHRRWSRSACCVRPSACARASASTPNSPILPQAVAA